MLISSDRLPKSFKDKAHQKVAKLSGSLLGAVTPERQATLPKEFELSPHTLYKRFGSTHYGVMIPDLPEPFRYLSWASVLGYVGFTITDTNYQMSKDGKGDTASLVHGTALSTTPEAYRTFSIKNDIKFNQTPFAINFDNQSVMHEDGDGFILITKREDLELELHLKPAKAISWFAYSAFYKHFSVLMHYDGYIKQKGNRESIKGLCTLESWKAVATSMLKNKWLVENIQLPVKVFSYQVINIDHEQQLLLAFICYEDQPILTSVYYRHIDGTSIQYNGDILFEVTSLQEEPQITPDGFPMNLPNTFRWAAYHNNQKVLDISAQVDTPYCFGLAAGFVSSYTWQGEFYDQPLVGRGYLEYIDRR